MLSAYLDDSGTHMGSPIYVMAGLLAPPLQWERLSREWQRVLDAEHLTDFHMADCANGGGDFSEEKGWCKERRAKVVVQLVQIIKRRVHWRTWTAVEMYGYREVYSRDQQEEFTISICSYGCASRIRGLVLDQLRRDLFVPCMFDRGGKGGSAVIKTLNSLKPTYYRAHPVSAGDRRLMLPLQAAELHAYEVHKYFADQSRALTGGKRRPPRKSFLELLSIPEAGGGGYLFTREKLIEMVRWVRQNRLAINQGFAMRFPPDNLTRARLVRLLPVPPDGAPAVADDPWS